MPRITKATLQEEIDNLVVILSRKNHEIDLLKMELNTMKSSYSIHGQVASMVIATEKIGDALAHTLGDLKRKPPF
jgi:hypothetical protein